MAVQIQARRGTAAAWTAANPVLADGEHGYETDTKQFKVGDGASVWTSLPYFSVSAARADLIPALLVGDVAGVQTIPAPSAGGAVGGSLAGTLPNPTFAGRDSSVDQINKDLLPALLVGDVAGVQSIPSTAASTAVGGSLAGTLPNPTFAGRDASVDDLNKDMLPALLAGDAAGVQVVPVLPAGSVGGSLAGTLPNPTFAGRDSSVDQINKDLLPAALIAAEAGVQSIPAATTAAVVLDFNQTFMLMGG